ncbi:HU domain-containing protein [Spirosoma koreense]
MASVNEYLKKLLYQYDCVVVPEFGAFLTHYQPAAFTETSGLYLPPRKRVAFNEALRFDDGILANYIMLHEPVTREGAQRHISQFVDVLREQVDDCGRFEIDGLGTFSRNDEGKLQFDPSLRHNFFGEAYGMIALSVQPVNRPALIEPVLEAVPVTALGPVRTEEAVLTPLRPARPYWQIAAAVLLIGSLGVVSYFSVLKPNQPLQSSLDPANLLRVPAAFASHSAPASKTAEKGTVYKTEPVATPAPKPAVRPLPEASVAATGTPAPVSAEPKARPVAVPVAKPEPIEAVAEPTATVRTGPLYTVIAGVFSTKKAALPLVRHLHKAGYPDAYVMIQGKKTLRYKVAAIGSYDRSELQAHLPEISRMIGSNAWVYTH